MGEILGEGYHVKAGLDHAEVMAYKDAQTKGNNVDGATLYVTLEPCAHQGKTRHVWIWFYKIILQG